MKKKLFSLILLFSFFYFNISLAVHEQYYIEELKGDENVIYNTLIKKYNKWNDESEADYSCNDLPVTFSLPVDTADCQYRKTTKYMKRNELNVSQEFLDLEYEFYDDVRARAVLVTKNLKIAYTRGNKHYERALDDLEKWQEYYYKAFKEKKFQQRDVWKEYALNSQNEIKKLVKDNKKKEKNNYTDYWWVIILLVLGTFFLYTMTVKKPKINFLRKKKSKQRGRIAKYWAGEESLAFSFWGVSTLGLTLLQLPNIMILSQGDEVFDSMSDMTTLIYALYIIIFFIIAIIAYVGCWRSAAKYIVMKNKIKKSTFWGYTTYVAIALSTLRVFTALVTGN